MHRLLFRQLKKTMGFSSIEEARAWLDELAGYAKSTSLPPALHKLLNGMMPFIERVDASYTQQQRDVEIRDRSIRLSSQELTEALEHARQDAAAQQQAVEALQRTANALLKDLNKPEIHEDSSNLSGLAALMTELTRERNEALREVELQREAIDQHAIIAVVDHERKIQYANSKFREISGFSNGELVGNTLQVIRSGYHSDAEYSRIWDTVSAGEVWHGELHNHNKDGAAFWVSSTVVPIKDEQDKPVRYVAIMTDITHQKLLEERVSVSQQFYQSITDSIGEGIFSVDNDGKTQFLNPEASRLLGWHLEDLAARRFHDTVQFQSPDKKFIPVQQSPLLANISKGEIYSSEETYFTHKDGTLFPVSITAVPLTDEQGIVKGYVGVFRNISERKNIEIAMRNAFAQAERANNAKGQFLANMSHEIRTPLNAIIGLTHLTLKTPLNVQQRDYLEKATHSANSLLTIISDILDFSKIEAGKTELEIQPFCFDELLEKVAFMFQDRAHSKGLTLLFDMQGDMTLPLLGDESRLMQIFNNLVSNAVKFTHAGQIVVTVILSTLPGNRVSAEIKVSDTGIGLSEEQQQNLFDPFTQADASISRKYGGTGLGMSITRHLIELMNGSITVHSETGKGSTFTLSAEFPRGRTRKTDSTHSLGAHQFLTLCCLDDSLKPVIRLLQQSLSTLQVPHAFCDAHEASALPDQTTHLLVLADRISTENMTALSAAFKSRGLDVSRLRIMTSGNQEETHHLLATHGMSQAVVMQLPFTQGSLGNFLIEKRNADADTTKYRSLEEPALIERRLAATEILIVDGDDISQTVLTQQLSASGIVPVSAVNGADCIAQCRERTFDAIILNNKLPDMPGWEVAESLIFGSGLTSPIICLTTEDPALISELVYDAGMCALLSKPISYPTLLATIDSYICHPSALPADYQLPTDATPFEMALLDFCHTYHHTGSQSLSEFLDGLQAGASGGTLDRLARFAEKIGASVLQQKCAQVANLRHSKVSAVALDALASELDSTVKKAIATLLVISKENTQPADEQLISAQVGEILGLLEDYDASAGDALQQLYNNYQQSEHRWVLQQAIQKVSHYDFEAASELLRPLMVQSEITDPQ